MLKLSAIDAPCLEMGHQLRVLLIQRVERADRRVDGAQQVLQCGRLLFGSLCGGQFGLGPRCCLAGISQLQPGIIQDLVIGLECIGIQKAPGLEVTQRSLLFVQAVQRLGDRVDILQQAFERSLLLFKTFAALLRRLSASAEYAVKVIGFTYGSRRGFTEFIQFIAGRFQIGYVSTQCDRGDLVTHQAVSLCITLRASLSMIRISAMQAAASSTPCNSNTQGSTL
ncbi:hypothetical protein D3C75_643180 [compost metagenome]